MTMSNPDEWVDDKDLLKRFHLAGNGALTRHHRAVLHREEFIHVGAAAEWLASRIKETNGHHRYVLGLVAHISFFDDPFASADQLFAFWREERVPPMLEGEVVNMPGPLGHLSIQKTITFAAARRLLKFVTEHYPADLPSEHSPGLTYGQGTKILAKCLERYEKVGDEGPIDPKLAHEIQAFSGVAYAERVRDPNQ